VSISTERLGIAVLVTIGVLLAFVARGLALCCLMPTAWCGFC
jgi:hypothetical protein